MYVQESRPPRLEPQHSLSRGCASSPLSTPPRSVSPSPGRTSSPSPSPSSPSPPSPSPSPLSSLSPSPSPPSPSASPRPGESSRLYYLRKAAEESQELASLKRALLEMSADDDLAPLPTDALTTVCVERPTSKEESLTSQAIAGYVELIVDGSRAATKRHGIRSDAVRAAVRTGSSAALSWREFDEEEAGYLLRPSSCLRQICGGYYRLLVLRGFTAAAVHPNVLLSLLEGMTAADGYILVLFRETETSVVFRASFVLRAQVSMMTYLASVIPFKNAAGVADWQQLCAAIDMAVNDLDSLSNMRGAAGFVVACAQEYLGRICVPARRATSAALAPARQRTNRRAVKGYSHKEIRERQRPRLASTPSFVINPHRPAVN